VRNDTLSDEYHARCSDADAVGVGPEDLATKQLAVKGAELAWVGAIE
jgi:hypothetical protein